MPEIQNSSEYERIELDVKDCRRCNLWSIRNKTVPGSIGTENKLVIVGAAPDTMDDRSGLPFSGKHKKKILTRFREMNMDPSKCSFLYCVKCLPMFGGVPGPPKRDSIFWCAEYLYKQLEILNPTLIVTFGYIPFYVLLRRKDPSFKFPKKISVKPYCGNLYKTESLLHPEITWPVIPIISPAIWYRNYENIKSVKRAFYLVMTLLEQIERGKDIQNLFSDRRDIP